MVTQKEICPYFLEIYTKNFRGKSHDIDNLKKNTPAQRIWWTMYGNVLLTIKSRKWVRGHLLGSSFV